MAAANPDDLRRRYFTTIAPEYSFLTSNTTRDHFELVLKENDLGITSSSVIHDSASGPGTATSVLVPWCAAHGVVPARIVATDYTPGMIAAFEAHKSAAVARREAPDVWARTEGRVADSVDLAGVFPDNHFTHKLDNFSVSTFGSRDQQMRGLREAYRTLAPGGLAVFTNWKVWPVADYVARVQARIKGADWARDHPVPMNGGEMMREGYLAGMMVEAGWAAESIQTATSRAVLADGGADWKGLIEFMLASPPAMAGKRGMSEEEASRWPDVVKEVLQEEMEEHGGVVTEAWVLLARKSW